MNAILAIARIRSITSDVIKTDLRPRWASGAEFYPRGMKLE